MEKIIGLDINKPSHTRREFIKDVAGKVGVIAIGSYTISFLNACSSDSNPVSSNNGGKSGTSEITIDINKSENSALKTVGGTIAISGNAIDSSGMLIIRANQNSVTALSRRCTHQGCTVPNFQNGISTCPCHGSKFNTSGGVTAGPASKSLTNYTATISDNIIKIIG